MRDSERGQGRNDVPQLLGSVGAIAVGLAVVWWNANLGVGGKVTQLPITHLDPR